jgi:DNA-binding XRE family transcriptional regulator
MTTNPITSPHVELNDDDDNDNDDVRPWDEWPELKAISDAMTFGSAIHALRLCDEWTQERLAKAVGISKQRLCDYEKGRHLPSPAKAAELAKAMGYGPEMFVMMVLQEQLVRSGLPYKVTLTP